MKVNASLSIFYTQVEPLTSGSKIFLDKEIIDINDFYEAICDCGEYVVICNNVDKYSDATKQQVFVLTDYLEPEDGYDITVTFTHFGRSLSAITNRKIVMSIKSGNNAKLKATYFNS